jgi:hypothetical protein
MVLEKVADGKNVLKIIVKTSGLEGQASNSKQDQSSVQQNTQSRPVRLVMPTGQTGPTMVSQPKMLTPKNPEVDEWKVVKVKVKGKVVKVKVKGKKKNFKPTFDYLLSKYVNQEIVWKDQSSNGSVASYLKQGRSRSHRSGYASNVIKIESVDVTSNNQIDNNILDHGATNKSLTSMYVQPRWCPPGLSHTQKRRLQRLRNQKNKKELKPLNEVPARPSPIVKK